MKKFAMIAATAVVALSALAAPAFALSIRPPMGGGPSNYPEGPRGGHQSSYECGAQFGHFKRVLPEQVAEIGDDYRIWVTPVCLGDELLRAEGNAAYLRPTIAENEVLVDALFDRNFGPDDVFAVKMMGDDTINLYVHDFAN